MLPLMRQIDYTSLGAAVGTVACTVQDLARNLQLLASLAGGQSTSPCRP